MDHLYVKLLIICPLVFLAGFVDSIAGGGGIISLPAYLFAGLPMHNALATNKFSSFCGSTIATGRYLKNGCVYKPLIIPTVICSLIGSAIGARLTLHVSDAVLKNILLVVLPVVAVLVFMKKPPVEKTQEKERRLTVMQFVLSSVIAFVIGMYDGFYGPGTGTFLMLCFTYFIKLDVRQASGNTKCVNWASNAAALLTFLFNGKVMFVIGACAAACSILGNYIGSGLVIKDGTKFVRPIVIVVLLLLFAKIVFKF